MQLLYDPQDVGSNGLRPLTQMFSVILMSACKATTSTTGSFDPSPMSVSTFLTNWHCLHAYDAILSFLAENDMGAPYKYTT